MLLFACETDAVEGAVDARVPPDAAFFDARAPDALTPDARVVDAGADAAGYCPDVTPIVGKRTCLQQSDCTPSELCSADGRPHSGCSFQRVRCTADTDCAATEGICEVGACGDRECMTPCTATTCPAGETCNGRTCVAPEPELCTRREDCACGSCVLGACRPQPGVCVKAAALP